jgi:hypothetical protein
MHVSLHEFLNQVHFEEALEIARFLNVENGDDVLMIEVTKELHLSKGAKTEHGMIEGSDFLDSHLLTARLVNGGTT